MTRGLTRELIALRVARELREGMYVNLGLGLPAQVADFISQDVEIVFESENGILGLGPMAEEKDWDPDLVDAGGRPATVVPGASFFDSTTSFAMIRGKHLDVTVLGAYQVSEKGDLASWMTLGQKVGSIGGAMDLAVGAKAVFVAMEHTSASGELRVVKECSYPITARKAVKLIFTNLAVLEVTREGLALREVAPGVTVSEVQDATEPRLIVRDDLREMHL